jgi:hypothetical protein
MLEGKKLEHKPTMKKLADVTPKERRLVEELMAKEPKQLINDLIVPALARNIDEIKALKLRVGLLEKMVIFLGAIVVGFAACVAFL